MRKTRAALQPQFRAAVKDSGVLEILIYEEIGQNFWTGEGITAKSVKKAIDAAGQFDSISLRINSPGGDAFEGAAIYSLLSQLGKPVDVFIDGIAASAASVIAMAGDTITMSNVAVMMIHNAWTCCCGNAKDMRACASSLETVSASIAQAYVNRTGMSEADVATLLDADTWMSAKDCVAKGFATSIAEPPARDAKAALALAASFKQLAKMANVPDAFKAVKNAMECDCDCQACQDGNCDDCTCDGCGSELCLDGNCEACNGTETQDSNLTQYEARLKMLGKQVQAPPAQPA